MSFQRNESGPVPMQFSQPQFGSFNTSAPSPSPASSGVRGSFGGYNDGLGTRTSYSDAPPQIYTAVYSNVQVYEMEVRGVAVMRRRSDAWLNATQILKVAGVAKGKRTKMLEREIAAGVHEKVQGGYGKYQGTWVSYARGIELCRMYKVLDLLRPLLEYDMGDSPGILDTPTKEQAMAAQRKRIYRGMDSQNIGSQGTFFQNISNTAVSAVNAINKARFESPVLKPNSQRTTSMRLSQFSSQDTFAQPDSQQSTQTVQTDTSFVSGLNNSQRKIGDDTQEPPRKRMRSLSVNQTGEVAPTESNDSFYQLDGMAIDPEQFDGLPALPPASTPEKFQKMKLVMTLFLDKNSKDFSTHPAFLTLTTEDLEIPLDDHRNNALHWAAMLARMPLVNALIAKGVSIYRLNGAGETALQKAVGTRNNHDYRSFHKFLQLLAPTIEIVDYQDRTVLHHIAVMAATGGAGHVAAKHYLEALLEFIVRYGGSKCSPADGGPDREIIGLGKFMSEMVNIQDEQGDTALNLAGRARTVLIPQLLEVGANPYIANHTGLKPADYGVGVDMINGGNPQSNEGEALMTKVAKAKAETHESAVSQISNLVEKSLQRIGNELTGKLGGRHEEFSKWHSKIRESAKARQMEQQHLDQLKCRARQRIEVDRQIKNLESSTEEVKALLVTLQSEQPADISAISAIGDADKSLALDLSSLPILFANSDDPAPQSLTEEQVASVSTVMAILNVSDVASLSKWLDVYNTQNAEISSEVESLKTKNVVLGNNYRRMVMACTGWTAEQVDEAAEGLTECVRDLNENPLPDDVAIEILMRDRGQDW